MQNKSATVPLSARPGRRKADALDSQVNATLQGSWLAWRKYITFACLSLAYAWGAALEANRQGPLRAALQAVQVLQLSTGAGLWVGPVVEGFFGSQEVPVHDVIGDTVNTAKRLCDHAKGGQLLAGPLENLPDRTAVQINIQAKGKLQPVLAAVYCVI